MEWDISEMFFFLVGFDFDFKAPKILLIGVRFDEQRFIGSKTRNGSGHVFCLTSQTIGLLVECNIKNTKTNKKQTSKSTKQHKVKKLSKQKIKYLKMVNLVGTQTKKHAKLIVYIRKLFFFNKKLK